MADKLTKLWNEYLLQALFTMRIWVHVTHEKSSFYLLYSHHPFLPSNENPSRSLELAISNEEHKKCITTLRTARAEANERLLVKAEHAQKIWKERVEQDCYKLIEAGKWVLIHHKDKHKFKSKWYRPYKVLLHHSLSTYQLKDPDDNMLVNLINSQCLIKAHIAPDANSKDFWASPENQVKL